MKNAIWLNPLIEREIEGKFSDLSKLCSKFKRTARERNMDSTKEMTRNDDENGCRSWWSSCWTNSVIRSNEKIEIKRNGHMNWHLWHKELNKCFRQENVTYVRPSNVFFSLLYAQDSYAFHEENTYSQVDTVNMLLNRGALLHFIHRMGFRYRWNLASNEGGEGKMVEKRWKYETNDSENVTRVKRECCWI